MSLLSCLSVDIAIMCYGYVWTYRRHISKTAILAILCMASVSIYCCSKKSFMTLYTHLRLKVSDMSHVNTRLLLNTSLNKGYYTCVSEPGALGNISDYRALDHPEAKKISSAMLVNKLTDNYCYCKRAVPLLQPPRFVSGSKNPCWRDSGILRCVPYFYIIGFSKCGTTDLEAAISLHPQIAEGPKETHWLDYLRFVNYLTSLKHYASIFTKASREIDKELRNKTKSSTIIGDSTPCTAWDSLLWRCFQGNDAKMTEPKITNADAVHALFPGAKIIIIIRNPTDRLYSRYMSWAHQVPHELYQNPSPQAFHNVSTEAVRLYSQCLQTRTPRECAYDGNLYTKSMSRLQEGFYSVYLRDWIRIFPKDQILLLRFEDYKKSRAAIVRRVWEFLGLDSLTELELNILDEMPIKNKGKHKKTKPMLAETRKLLDNFYRPFQAEMKKLIDRGSFSLAAF